MTRYNAAWIVPIFSPPIRNGWVEVNEQLVTALGSLGDPPCKPTTHQIDLKEAIILPSLVNAHTHLELSSLKGHVAPAQSMPAWVRQVFKETSLVGFDEGEVVNAGLSRPDEILIQKLLQSSLLQQDMKPGLKKLLEDPSMSHWNVNFLTLSRCYEY